MNDWFISIAKALPVDSMHFRRRIRMRDKGDLQGARANAASVCAISASVTSPTLKRPCVGLSCCSGTAIFGFPVMDAPADIFHLALWRTEEIVIGIVSAALVSIILFLRSICLVVAERVAFWLRDAKLSLEDAPGGEETASAKKPLAAACVGDEANREPRCRS